MVSLLNRAFPLARRALFCMDAEDAHSLTLKILKNLPVSHPDLHRAPDPRLSMTVLGRTFPNPVGLAAGFDKNGETMAAMAGFGFGFVEIGTVTPKPQEGNDRPRVFRAPKQQAIINRMGFPNGGLDRFRDNIRQFRQAYPQATMPVGLNIGMNKNQTAPEEDYALLIAGLAGFADYLCVNISSPNTPGLRNLQDPGNLAPFLHTLRGVRDAQPTKPPLLVKLAPDIADDDFVAIMMVIKDIGLDGIVLTNTTLARPAGYPASFLAQKGGLSGPAVRDMATAKIHQAYAMTEGRLPIIGLGGIASGEDAYQKIRAGASLVQLYTALVYHGPGLINEICRDLKACLDRDGFATLAGAVGADHRSTAALPEAAPERMAV